MFTFLSPVNGQSVGIYKHCINVNHYTGTQTVEISSGSYLLGDLSTQASDSLAGRANNIHNVAF
jgi:hypothetical protein